MAGFQERCGAFTGGIIALGQQISRQGRDYKEHKKVTDEAVRELAKRLKEKYGDFRCRPLVGYDFSDPEQLKAFRKSDVPKTTCRPMVEFVVKQVLATVEEGGVLPTK